MLATKFAPWTCLLRFYVLPYGTFSLLCLLTVFHFRCKLKSEEITPASNTLSRYLPSYKRWWEATMRVYQEQLSLCLFLSRANDTLQLEQWPKLEHQLESASIKQQSHLNLSLLEAY